MYALLIIKNNCNQEAINYQKFFISFWGMTKQKGERRETTKGDRQMELNFLIKECVASVFPGEIFGVHRMEMKL